MAEVLRCNRLDERARAGRLKQWLNFLRCRFPEAEAACQQIRSVHEPLLIEAWMAGVLAEHKDQSSTN